MRLVCDICGQVGDSQSQLGDLICSEMWAMHPNQKARVDAKVTFLKMGDSQGNYTGEAKLCYECMTAWMKSVSHFPRAKE